jgi:hypothetical protein
MCAGKRFVSIAQHAATSVLSFFVKNMQVKWPDALNAEKCIVRYVTPDRASVMLAGSSHQLSVSSNQ